MRTLTTVLAMAVLMLLGGRLAAQEEKEKAGPAERIQDLNLTDEQETKIADIVKEYRPKNEEAVKDLTSVVKDEVEKVRAVLTAEQREKLDSLKEERKEHREDCLAHRIAHLKELDLTDDELTKIGEIRTDFRPKIVKAMKGLEGLLSDDQRKVREDALKAGKRRKEVLESLKLTDEQKEKVTTVAKEVGTLFREEMEKIQDILTASQKEKIQEFNEERREQVRDRMAHRIANLKDLNLTDEQKTKIMEIRKEFRPKVQEAGNKLRATVREELQMIAAVVKG
jgi:Spy/CpxP family protein refolding chaperone